MERLFAPQHYAEMVSLALTFPTIALSIAVVVAWLPGTTRGWTSANTNPERAQAWFMTGVCMAFVGSILDNTYWAVPWSMSFIGHPAEDSWMSHGVYFNIWFRQAAGTFAAYCHLRAARLAGLKVAQLAETLFGVSMLIGIAYVVALYLYRG